MQLISQTMLLPILLFLVLIFLFQRKQTITSLSLSISFLLLGLHSHYSIFILLPFVGMWWMMLYVSFVKTHVGILKWKCIIPAVVGVVGVGVWILLSYQSFPLDQVAILKIGNTQLLTQYVAQLNIAISEYLYVLFYWYMQPKSIGLAVLGIGFISLGVWSLYLARRATSQTIGSLCVLVGLNIVPFILAGKYTNTIFTAYVLAVLPIGVFTIAFILRALMHKFPYIGISVLLIVLGFYTRMTVWELTNRSGISYYQLNSQIAVAINNDNARLTYPDTNMYPFTIRFVVADEPTYLNEWQSGGIWFHLESITKKKLVVLKETDADFQSIEQNPSYTYIVCNARSATDKRTEANGCETTKETLQHTYKQVFELIYQKYPYWVWRMYGSVQGV
jgi:hypothetical protein